MDAAVVDRRCYRALELLIPKFEDLGKRCPEPLYAFATAVDVPPPSSPDFSDGLWQALEHTPEPYAPAGSSRLGLVRTGYSMALSRNGFELIATQDSDARLYTVGVLGRRSQPFVDALTRTLHKARSEGNDEAVRRLRFELTLGPRSAALDSWLNEYEILAGRAWDCVPTELKSLHSHLYMYPLAMAKPAWAWTAFKFVLAWTSAPANGLIAPRVLVGTSAQCDVEGSLRAIEAAAPQAVRGSPEAAAAVAEQRRLLAARHSPLWPSYDSGFGHPLPRCRALMEPPLCDASVLAIEQVASRCAKRPATQRKKSKHRKGTVPGWTLKALAAYAGIGRSLFLDICEEVGIKRADSGGHGYEFTLEELRAMVARCKTISGKRLWAHAGTKWQELIDDHVRRSSGA